MLKSSGDSGSPLSEATTMHNRRADHPIKNDSRSRGGEDSGNPISKTTRETSLLKKIKNVFLS